MVGVAEVDQTAEAHFVPQHQWNDHNQCRYHHGKRRAQRFEHGNASMRKIADHSADLRPEQGDGQQGRERKGRPATEVRRDA